MTGTRWLILAGLVAGLVGLQAGVLDRMEEKITEDSFSRVPNVSTGDMLQTTIAVRFFGATRAIVIDYLWIKLRKLEKEKRWYQRRNVLRYISYYQPRNPGVWVHLGWHSAYNVANGFTDPDRAWEWVKFGLEWLRRGVDNIPDHPEIKYEIGWTLLHKPTWRGDGWQDEDLLRRVEEDGELQKLLQERREVERSMSAFELAIRWFERARMDLEKKGKPYMYSQMGLYIGQDTMDGFALNAMHHEAMRRWRAGRREEANAWFLKAADQAALILDRYEVVSPIYRDRERFYRGLPEIVDLEAKAGEGGTDAERALLERMQEMLVADADEMLGPLDEGYLWSPTNPDAMLNALKQKFVRDQDIQECNDGFGLFATRIRPQGLYQANLEPRGLDTDVYRIELPRPEGLPREVTAPPRPVEGIVKFDRPDTAGMDLRVRVYDPERKVTATAEIRGRGEIRFEVKTFGAYHVQVDPLDPDGAWPDDTRYTLRWMVADR